MNHIGGVGGYASSARWRKTTLSKRGEKALSLLSPDDHTVEMLKAHDDSENFRRFAERFRKKKSNLHQKEQEDNTAQFELDQISGQIELSIYEANSGKIQVTLTAEQVAEGLKSLEEAEDDAEPLSTFFVDIKV